MSLKVNKLTIQGMHCSGCSTRLENILNNLEGVESVKVSLEKSVATIKYNDDKISLKMILQEIEDAGFRGE